MSDQIKFKKGLSSNLDTLAVENGSVIYTTDDNKLYIDTDTRNSIGGSGVGGARLVHTATFIIHYIFDARDETMQMEAVLAPNTNPFFTSGNLWIEISDSDNFPTSKFNFTIPFSTSYDFIKITGLIGSNNSKTVIEKLVVLGTTVPLIESQCAYYWADSKAVYGILANPISTGLNISFPDNNYLTSMEYESTNDIFTIELYKYV